MDILQHKKIILGVCGGIAAYKSVELVRRLTEQGAVVQVIMTQAAADFIGPLTFHAVSGQTCLVHGSAQGTQAMAHIELARWADAILIAPATAHTVAKLSHGLADDLLSNLCLAATVPIAVAPAMNQAMWSHGATQANIALLAQRGVLVWGPDEGIQACGEAGLGRMLAPAVLLAHLEALLSPRQMAGIKLLINAGPTYEDIDPVRFLGNRSSGKMGFALAAAAHAAGAEVTLISGPVALPTPVGVARHDVRSSEQMHTAVMRFLPEQDIFIAAAAVADFKIKQPALQKIKKSQGIPVFELSVAADILAAVSALAKRPFMVGFAAETTNLADNARLKLAQKRLDMVIANQITAFNPAIGGDDNEVTVFWSGGQQFFALEAKLSLAHKLMVTIATRFHEKNSSQNS